LKEEEPTSMNDASIIEQIKYRTMKAKKQVSNVEYEQE